MEAPVSTDSFHSSFTQLTQRNLLDIDSPCCHWNVKRTTGNPKESWRLPQSQPYSVVLCGPSFSSPLLITDFTLLLKLVHSYMEDYKEDREQEVSMMLVLLETSPTPGLLGSTLHCPTVSAVMSHRWDIRSVWLGVASLRLQNIWLWAICSPEPFSGWHVNMELRLD